MQWFLVDLLQWSGSSSACQYCTQRTCKYLMMGVRHGTVCIVDSVCFHLKLVSIMLASFLSCSLTKFLTFILMHCHSVILSVGLIFLNVFYPVYLSVSVYSSPASVLVSPWQILSFYCTSITSIEARPPARPSAYQQTAAQSVDTTSFDMVKQYCTSSLFLFAHLWRRCH